jgi:hypothetical protein
MLSGLLLPNSVKKHRANPRRFDRESPDCSVSNEDPDVRIKFRMRIDHRAMRTRAFRLT